jgi:hypothetical protein
MAELVKFCNAPKFVGTARGSSCNAKMDRILRSVARLIPEPAVPHRASP